MWTSGWIRWGMGLEPNGALSCDTCGVLALGGVESAAVTRWGVFQGKTQGGQDLVVVTCPSCRGESRKRPVRKRQDFEDEPMF